MSIDMFMLIFVGILVACGIYLVLERALTRVLLGFLLLSNALNVLLLLLSGPAGQPSFFGFFSIHSTSDPLAQALGLTSIVISVATAAFIIALAYRSFTLTLSDEVKPIVEDTLNDDNLPSAAEELVDADDHYRPAEDPKVDRAYDDDFDEPTGDLFEPLNIDDLDSASADNEPAYAERQKLFPATHFGSNVRDNHDSFDRYEP